ESNACSAAIVDNDNGPENDTVEATWLESGSDRSAAYFRVRMAHALCPTMWFKALTERAAAAATVHTPARLLNRLSSVARPIRGLGAGNLRRACITSAAWASKFPHEHATHCVTQRIARGRRMVPPPSGMIPSAIEAGAKGVAVAAKSSAQQTM